MAYVYRHIRLDTEQPIYIGIGSDASYIRAASIKYRNKHWVNVYNKHGMRMEILVDELTRDQACEKEKEFIKLYGRLNNKTGILVNMTDGGEGAFGTVFTQEQRDAISKRIKGIKHPPRSDAFREMISFVNTGRTASKETRKKLSIAAKGRTHTEETKNKLSIVLTGKKRTEEMNKRMSIAKSGEVFSQEIRDRMSKARKLIVIGYKELPILSNKVSVFYRNRYAPIEQYDLKWNLIKIHKNIIVASEELKMTKETIRCCIRGKQYSAEGFKFKKI